MGLFLGSNSVAGFITANKTLITIQLHNVSINLRKVVSINADVVQVVPENLSVGVWVPLWGSQGYGQNGEEDSYLENNPGCIREHKAREHSYSLLSC